MIISPTLSEILNFDHFKVNYSCIWKFNAKAGINSAITISSNKLYLMTKTGYLITLNQATGKYIWSVKPQNIFDGNPKYSHPSIIYFDKVVTLNMTQESFQNFSKRVSYNSSLIYNNGSSILSKAGVVIGGVNLYDMSSGTLIWEKNIKSTRKSHPIVSKINNSHVILISSKVSNIYAIDPYKGTVIWKSLLDGGTLTTPVEYFRESKTISEFGITNFSHIVFVGIFYIYY
jgi:outer membrane protein assembly factor BamB